MFTRLSASRQAGQTGPQPISMSDTYALAAMMGFDSSDDFEFILMAIPKLDNIYLENAYSEAEKKRKSQQKSAANKPQARRGRG